MNDGKDPNPAIEVAKRLKKELDAGKVDQVTKQAPKITDLNLRSTVNAVVGAVADGVISNHPRNASVEIQASADKRGAWLEENFPDLDRGPCKGPALDLQIRNQSTGVPIANVESEIHGNKERNKDFKKLVGHSETPGMSIMIERDQSKKNVEKTFESRAAASSKREEPFVLVNAHMKKNDTLDKAEHHVRVYQGGKLLWSDKAEAAPQSSGEAKPEGSKV